MNDYTKWHQSQPDDEAIERIEGKMKTILIMDMPKNCNECDLLIPTVGNRYMCAKTKWRVSDVPILAGIPNNCPLLPARGYIDEHGNLISWEDDSDGCRRDKAMRAESLAPGYWECPGCRMNTTGPWLEYGMKFCPNCGQRLKWEDDNELD